MADELHRYRFVVDGRDITGFNTLNDDDLPPAAEIGSKVRSFMNGYTSFDVELKRGHDAQRAFYEWMRKIDVPVEPWTFPVHDETQGPDWLVIYTKSHFTSITPVPGGDGVSIGVEMSAREVWLRCPHGMISDDETEAMFIAEKALEETGITVTPLDVAYEHFEVEHENPE